jgi:chorismate--pyruvate lyase
MLPPRWVPAPPLHAAARPLRQPGSLTARLARSGKVTVDVLASGWQAASPDEAAALGLARAGMRIYARLVCVRRDGKAAVLARSVTTIKGIRVCWKRLRRLGRQPLATLLWSDLRICRGPFEYARMAAGDPLARAVGHTWASPARRSTFRHQGEPLIVMEAFVDLPWPTLDWTARRRRWTATS